LDYRIPVIVGTAALATASVGFSVLQLSEGIATMESQHWIMLLIVLVAGYVLGRVWTQPAQMVGLP
jgi:lysylphosphatidylglycerol synthetase-like protein (DUF2156 family)